MFQDRRDAGPSKPPRSAASSALTGAEPVQRTDIPVQATDGGDEGGAALRRPAGAVEASPSADGGDEGGAALRRQIGVVGASFLRVRPWLVAGPAGATLIAMLWAEAPPTRIALVVAVQFGMLSFFIWEAVGLARAGAAAYVSPRRLGWSLALTVTALGVVSLLTGASRSPMLPMLLAPTGIAYAAFGARPGGLRFLGYLVGWLVLLAGFSAFDPWPPLPAPVLRLTSLVAVGLAAVLLWYGVAALTTAHAAVAADLDRLRHVALREAALRVRDLEAVGAKVAHELKNPLTAVKALTQLQARADPQAAERDRVIQAELERVTSTLEAYLSYARPLDDLRWRTVEPRVIVESVAAALEGRAAAAQIDVQVRTDAGDAVLDPDRVRDALLNLASNAVDATPHGGRVVLQATFEPLQVVLTVADTGVGMDPATLTRVGTPYFTTRDGGTGLGVVLARTVAHQHGGRLTYESRLRRGTIARMTLPIRPGLAAKQQGQSDDLDIGR